MKKTDNQQARFGTIPPLRSFDPLTWEWQQAQSVAEAVRSGISGDTV